MIQLILQNVGRLDLHPSGSVKLAVLHHFMSDHQVDIATLTKCNVAWNKVDYLLHPPTQTKFWWEMVHWVLSHNCQDLHAASYQLRGVGIVVTNQLAHRAQQLGNDKVGLSHWCWAWLHGKNNHFLWIVATYHPCPADGPLMTYQQQVCFWSTQKTRLLPSQKVSGGLHGGNNTVARRRGQCHPLS